MVGIVIVAHSSELAEAIKLLAQQMLRKTIPIASVGGIDDPANPFGTDATKIQKAIESVFNDDGVIVLMDLGSALLSAEMSLEFLSDEKRKRVHLCEAPLVEGTIAAAVQSEAGGSLEQVVEEALGSLTAKADQLKKEHFEPVDREPQHEKLSAQKIRVVLKNPLGIHARPAAKLVSTASMFKSTITIRNITDNTTSVNAKSINKIITLGARKGHEITIQAEGPDAREALAAMKSLIEDGFDEVQRKDLKTHQIKIEKKRSHDQGEFHALPTSPGIAIGPVVHYRLQIKEVKKERREDTSKEWTRLQNAISMVKQEITSMRSRMTTRAGDYEASIFDAHLLSLEDPAMIESVRRIIFKEKINAEFAWHRVLDEMIESYNRVQDSYIRIRGGDLSDLKNQVLCVLMGGPIQSLQIKEPSIVVTKDLGPSDMLRLDKEKVLGICTVFGGPHSHSAILARALGIPMVVGTDPKISRVQEGTRLVLDGGRGKIWVNPGDIQRHKRKQIKWLQSQQKRGALGKQEAVTIDGKKIEIAANITGAAEAHVALQIGAEGVGVFRTEFLFLRRVDAPSEEEQLTVYNDIARILENRPFIIRTLDIGGDKPLPYIDLKTEFNPLLGERGIRLCRVFPNIFKTQLRAILRSSPGHQIKILFPMIATLDEIKWAKNIFHDVAEELDKKSIPFDREVELGIMIEVPSAVLISDQLATEVDFFSIGTNDLCQYIMAADRTNSRLISLNDSLHPAVLRMISQTVQSAHKAGIWVGLCGELAADKCALPILIGLGIEKLSMGSQAIPSIKQTIRSITMEKAKIIAERAMNLESALAVRRYVTEKLI